MPMQEQDGSNGRESAPASRQSALLNRVLEIAVSLLGLLLFAPVILGAALVYLPEHRAAAAAPAIQDQPARNAVYD
jgi:lipopolysaccharide/colanic/teichoic acid biosynthesis glycosyltransferase